MKGKRGGTILDMSAIDARPRGGPKIKLLTGEGRIARNLGQEGRECICIQHIHEIARHLRVDRPFHKVLGRVWGWWYL